MVEQDRQAGDIVYHQAHTDFKAFLSRDQASRVDHAQRTHAAHQEQPTNDVTVQYSLLLRQMLHGASSQTEVSDFLFKVWAEVLTASSVRYGHQHAQTHAFKQAVNALVWATGTRKTRRNRARMVKNVPHLLLTLRDAMDVLGLTEDEKNRHITTLKTPRMAAFLNKKTLTAVASPR
jgi:MoxR-like ATPase